MNQVSQMPQIDERTGRHSSEELLPLVYSELRELAAARLGRETPGQTLQPTALVHEAYLRLVGANCGLGWENRGHFFGAAAEAMRRILVDRARAKGSEKRGGQLQRRPLEPEPADQEPGPSDHEELIALDEALTRLEVHDPVAAKFVKLRYFLGMNIDETAELLNMSRRSAYYAWTYARTWLRRAIDGRDGDESIEA